jgi:Cu/Ag efflux protein CusF
MKQILFALALVGISIFSGCQRAQSTKPGEYPIEGKVLAVNKDKPAVKLDHKDIPGLMQAMQMELSVSDAKLLDGLKEGDYVRGKLKVEDGKTVIFQLEKSDGQSSADAEIKESLAKLSPEDRKLAEAQRFCAVQGKKSRLGAMGTPVKVMVKGQPVFLCCDACTETAQANPDRTLARVEELWKENR